MTGVNGTEFNNSPGTLYIYVLSSFIFERNHVRGFFGPPAMADDFLGELFTGMKDSLCANVIYYVQGPEAYDRHMMTEKKPEKMLHVKVEDDPSARKLPSNDASKTGDDERLIEKHQPELRRITDNDARVRNQLKEASMDVDKYNRNISRILHEIQLRNDKIRQYSGQLREMEQQQWETITMMTGGQSSSSPAIQKVITKDQLKRALSACVGEVGKLKKLLKRSMMKKANASKLATQHEALLDKLDTLRDAIETTITNKRFIETVKDIDNVQQSISGSLRPRDIEKMMLDQEKTMDQVDDINDIISKSLGTAKMEDGEIDEEELEELMASYGIVGDIQLPERSGETRRQTSYMSEPTPMAQLRDDFETDVEQSDEPPRRHHTHSQSATGRGGYSVPNLFE